MLWVVTNHDHYRGENNQAGHKHAEGQGKEIVGLIRSARNVEEERNVHAHLRNGGSEPVPGAHDRPRDATPTRSRASPIACTLSKPPLGTPRIGTACDCSTTVTSSAATRISRSVFQARSGRPLRRRRGPMPQASKILQINANPKYHRKEREEDSDGGNYVVSASPRMRCAPRTADTLLLPRA